MPTSTPIDALAQLGFSPLEAAIYATLLGGGPATGYRVAQVLGKAVANTYHAIEALQAKGAVMAVEGGDANGEARLVRAVEPDELVARLQRNFAQRCSTATDALSTLHQQGDDERVYALRSREQVLQRCIAMLRDARATIVVDALPAVLEALRTELAAAARRGVGVAVLAYRPVTIARTLVVVHARTALIGESWPWESVVLVVDGMQHVIALLSSGGDEVRQALWSRSVFASCVQHDGLVCQLITQVFDQLLEGKATIGEARAVRRRLDRISILKTPGYRRLAAGEAASAGATRTARLPSGDRALPRRPKRRRRTGEST